MLIFKAKLYKLTSDLQTSQPTLENFEKLLEENATVFHSARTAQALQSHWQLMKQYHLLPDQSGGLILFKFFNFAVLINSNDISVQPLPKSDHVVSFTDADELLRDSELAGADRDEVLEAELSQNDR